MNSQEDKKQARISQLILFGSIFAAIFGMMFLKGQTYDNVGQLCPAVEKITYITVYAYKDGAETDGVTRDSQDFRDFVDLCTATTLQDDRKGYMGIDYEDVMYTVEMGYQKTNTSFSVVPEENAIYHSNGKYLLEGSGEALYAWLAGHSDTE